MQEYVPSAAERLSNGVTIGSSAGALIAGLTLSDIALVVGIVVPILALVSNWAITIYFKREHLKLARERCDLPDGGDK